VFICNFFVDVNVAPGLVSHNRCSTRIALAGRALLDVGWENGKNTPADRNKRNSSKLLSAHTEAVLRLDEPHVFWIIFEPEKPALVVVCAARPYSRPLKVLA
jgi:hypothetical protein